MARLEYPPVRYTGGAFLKAGVTGAIWAGVAFWLLRSGNAILVGLGAVAVLLVGGLFGIVRDTRRSRPLAGTW